MNSLVKTYKIKSADGKIKLVKVVEFYSQVGGLLKRDGFVVKDVIVC